MADIQDMDSMISAAAEPVIGVLNMYIQAPGESLGHVISNPTSMTYDQG